jgi:hypothetical protein
LILKITSHKHFKKFPLFLNEISCLSYHRAKPLVHFLLIRASGHPIEFTKLFNKLLHRVHSCSESLTLWINILRAFNYFVIKNLIRINKVCHFTTKYRTIWNHLGWYSSLIWYYIFHFSNIFGLFCLLHCILKLFKIGDF